MLDPAFPEELKRGKTICRGKLLLIFSTLCYGLLIPTNDGKYDERYDTGQNARHVRYEERHVRTNDKYIQNNAEGQRYRKGYELIKT